MYWAASQPITNISINSWRAARTTGSSQQTLVQWCGLLAAVWVIHGLSTCSKWNLRSNEYFHPSQSALSHLRHQLFLQVLLESTQLTRSDDWQIVGVHFCEAWIALCPLPAVGMLGNCRPCSSNLCRWWQECVLTRAKLWLWHLHAGRERPVLPIQAQPNEPVDPVQLRDVTWYPSRLNLASVTLTLKQESTLLFAPDLAANLQVKVA